MNVLYQSLTLSLCLCFTLHSALGQGIKLDEGLERAIEYVKVELKE